MAMARHVPLLVVRAKLVLPNLLYPRAGSKISAMTRWWQITC